MRTDRRVLNPGVLLVLAGVLLACFAWGGWLNRPVMWTYVWRDTELARLSLQLGFVPDGNTVLSLLGVGLMLTGAAWCVVGVLRVRRPPTGRR